MKKYFLILCLGVFLCCFYSCGLFTAKDVTAELLDAVQERCRAKAVADLDAGVELEASCDGVPYTLHFEKSIP